MPAPSVGPGTGGRRRRTPLELQVRDALVHLHDLPYLRTHPLVRSLPQLADLTPLRAAEALQERLKSALAALHSSDAPISSAVGRRHRLMALRYLEGLELDEVCRALGIGRALYHREHTLGLEAVCVVVMQHRLSRSAASPDVVDTPPPPNVDDPVSMRQPIATPTGETPLVGRANEMARLRAAFDAMSAQARGRALLLSGPPGIGKTRLAYELAAYAQVRGAVLLDAHYQRDGTAPYAVWAAVLRAGLRTQPASRLPELVGAFAREIAWFCPDLVDPVPGADQSAADRAEQRHRLFDAVAETLLRLAAETKLVVVIDDVQWAPQLDLFAHVARRATEGRLLLVVTARSDELVGRGDLARTWQDLVRLGVGETIAVGPLMEAEASVMAAHFLSAPAAAALGSALFKRTGGNAFFLEETLRSLVELRRRPTDTEGVDPLVELTLPATVSALILERVAKLGPTALDVLGRAAVLGETFAYPLLERMGDQDESALGIIEAAVSTGLLADASTAVEERYRFVEDHVHEALYAAVSVPRRRRLHHLAAKALEELAGDRTEPHLEDLARHFGEARQSEKAARYALEAGEKSDRLFGWAQALAYYRRAVALWEEIGGHEADRAAALEHLVDLGYHALTTVEQSVEYAREALALYEQLGDRLAVGRMHAKLGREYVFGNQPAQTDHARAYEHFQEAGRLLDDQPDERDAVSAMLASTCATLLRADEGVVAGRRALAAAERLGQANAIGEAAMGLAAAHLLSGALSEGLVVLERAWELARRERIVDLQDRCCSQAAGRSASLADPMTAFAWSRRGSGHPTAPALTLVPGSMLAAHALRGTLVEGAQLLDELRERFAAAGQPTFTRHPGLAGKLLYRLGRVAEAREVYAAGMAWAAETRYLLTDAGIRIELADLVLDEGDAAQAADHLTWALDRARPGGARLVEAMALARLVGVSVRLGDLAAAEEYVAAATAALGNGEDWRGLPATLFCGAAQLRAAQGRWDEAEAEVRRAEELHERLGLRWDQAKLWYDWGEALHRRGGSSAAEGRRLVDRGTALWQEFGAGEFASAYRQRE